MNKESRKCQNCHQDFAIEPDDFDFYKKISVPSPTFCPQCRMMRRFLFRNERHLFRRKDAHTGKDIFSGISPSAPAKVYELSYWQSDAWDPVGYGKEYDFSKPFFEQFKELLYEVPWPSRSIQNFVNSEYSDNAGNLKNAYLCFNGDNIENSAYCVNFNGLKDCF